MALPDEPLTRSEQYLNRTATGSGTIPDEPLTRVEQYLAKIAGEDVTVPDVPYTRIEQYLAYIAENGGGGGGVDPESITLETLNVVENGTTNAPTGKAYNKVVANVPNTYAAGDEGKVVSNGSLVSQTAHAEVTQNGTIDTTTNNSVTVNVPTPSGTKQISITENGTTTENVAAYANAEITVNVSGGGGGGTDYSPFKIVKGVMTPSTNTSQPSLPCGDIKSVLYCVCVVTDYEDYISAENNNLGLGQVYATAKPIFDDRTWNGQFYGQQLCVYDGSFSYWGTNGAATVDETNQVATLPRNGAVIYRAGLPIEYFMVGV